jgi:hypothetical protein
MEEKNLDWFRFFPNRFYFGTLKMPDHAVGRYMKLLCEEWFNGDISDDLAGMEDILTVTGEIISIENSSGASRGVANEFDTSPDSIIKIRLNRKALWEILRTKFDPVGHGRYANRTLEEERLDTHERLKKQEVNRENGRKGGNKSAAKRSFQLTIGSTMPSSGGSSDGRSGGLSPGNSSGQSGLQPITVHNSNIKNYSQQDFLDEESVTDDLTERLRQLVEKNLNALLLAGDLSNRPANFTQFAIEYWIRDVLAKGMNISEKKLRENFVDVINKRMSEIEQAFTRHVQDADWFIHELNRVAGPDLPPWFINKFRDYYLKPIPSGGYFFQTFTNFDLAKTLSDWIANERPARNRGNGTPHPPTVKATPVYEPTEDEKRKFDDDIKRALNKKYYNYTVSRDVRSLTTSEYQFLFDYGADIVSTEEVETRIKPKIREERKKLIADTKEGKDVEGTKRLFTLKKQYSEGTLDNEELARIHREAYVRAIVKCFDKLMEQGHEKIFEV